MILIGNLDLGHLIDTLNYLAIPTTKKVQQRTTTGVELNRVPNANTRSLSYDSLLANKIAKLVEYDILQT